MCASRGRRRGASNAGRELSRFSTQDETDNHADGAADEEEEMRESSLDQAHRLAKTDEEKLAEFKVHA